MKEGRPSLTAVAVSFARGAAQRAQGKVLDSAAATLCPDLAGRTLRSIQHGSVPNDVVRYASFGLVDHLEMRTLAFDEALLGAVRRGVRQLVILGAGLDARAWRLRELASCVVFEVDYPSTQQYKQRRVRDLGVSSAKDVRFVTVDFANERFSDRLEEAGHLVDEPTFWIWEGVTMYLPVEATALSLDLIAQRSALGSELALTYMVPGLLTRRSPMGLVARTFMRGIGEPVVGVMSSKQIANAVESRGFKVQMDESTSEWAARHNHKKPLGGFFRAERMLLCARS